MTKNSHSVVHLTSSVSRLAGGLYESVRYLSKSIQEAGDWELTVVGSQDSHTERDIQMWAPLRIKTCSIAGPPRFAYSPALMELVMQEAPDLLHLHGLWQYPSVVASRWARRTRKPYLVSPHGMLEPWSLKHSPFLKGVAMLLYQKACLQSAACIRATSMLEAESIRLAGFKNPIAVIPNGVEFPAALPPRHPKQKQETRRALFLSRIHPKKGLLNLVEAWRQIQPSNWELSIVGPDEGGHLAEVQTAVRAAGLQSQITFPGEMWGEARNRQYLEADLFVLPSFSENFGLVIAEALSYEVPVITTRATPWSELVERDCGWWIDTGLEPLISALRDALASPSARLQEMGGRGRNLIGERYGWAPIGSSMVALYEWMLVGGPKPSSVI